MNPRRSARLLASVLISLVAACSPGRWDHADVSQLSDTGESVQTWKDVEIIQTGPGAFSGGDAWIRFRPRGGKEISLICPHKIEYR